MCGITGIFGNLRKEEFDSSIHEMSATLNHRGPDDAGTWINEENGVAFGHQRLSIIDLSSAGHQPMVSHCGRFTTVFNGEIYNHLQLRDKLNTSANKQSWKGHSDTETLVTAFSQWGIEKTLQQLVGMFAIAVWDFKEKRLFLIRDRFGEKPLYYGWSNGVFLFGSELKALQKYKRFSNQIDRGALSLYMKYMYVPTPYSIFRDIYKLEPGCILQIDKGTKPPTLPLFAPFRDQGINIAQWYSISNMAQAGQKNLITDQNDAVDLIEKTLLESVRSQLISDVPLGAFLSGGIDSSVITALMQKVCKDPVKTFTIGFEESSFNEAIYAKEVSRHLGTEHHELYVTSSDAFKVIPHLPTLYDEPFADSSQIPTYLVSKLARESVTVSLSGDAGDELFGGYNRYLWGSRVWNKVRWMPLIVRQTLGVAINKISVNTWDSIGNSLPNSSRVSLMGDKAHRMAHRLKNVKSLDDVYHSLVTEGYKEDGLVVNDKAALITKLDNNDIVSGIVDSEHRMMLLDSLTYLPDDILTKVDRAAMGVSLETRIPFLDYRVAELAWRLPLDTKINNGETKWPIRQVLYKYVPKVLIERTKAGFAIPVGQWIRGPLREWAADLLNEERIRREGYFNPELVQQLWQQHLSGKYDWTPRLWAILMFQAWLDK
ncbi:MAG: asparagine synthase (glutamine-hydrolyzing) [Gammaproteobacteria bacterium]|jgi:asparagine synthase (glutamine-hydrolysing)|nr:asparagine synthase (glutamine-hydrolyzing) [Gammaproteobacteria bacterium]